MAAVVLIGMVATVLVVGVRNSTPGEALADPNAKPKQQSSSSTKSHDPLQPKATGPAMVPGWTPIAINDGAQLVTDKAYDVPPQWAPLNYPAQFTGTNPKTSIYIPALYMRGYCPDSPNSFRSMAGLLVVNNKGELNDQIKNAAKQISDAVYTTKDGAKATMTVGEPKTVKIFNNKDALIVTAHVTAIPASENDKCNPTSSIITVLLLLPDPDKPSDVNTALAAWADQGFPEATSEDDLTKIVTSIHKAN
ncbi:hypothetical protein ACFQ1S_24180 [Kibdelosporangium lantanae]|uniref:DUF8017 domain-containing protein n=1 Tax=Kibdelosporangium lantanae TaxID=1497396 RepID=A0ABW3MCB6_9PSEU